MREFVVSRLPHTRDGRIALAGLLVILSAGFVLRVLFLLAWRRAFFGFPDSVSYVGLAMEKLWVDPAREVGYPLFLREMHALFPTHLTWVIALQHMFGLASAVLVFLAVNRAGGPPWLGLLPAAVVALNGAEMFLEHSALTESLFIFLLALGLYLATRAAGARTPVWATVEQYTFDATVSPADKAFGKGAGPFWSTQESNKLIAAWTHAVILHQPVVYLESVLEGIIAYVRPTDLVFPSHAEVGADFDSFYHHILFEPQEQEIARQTRLNDYGANGYKIDQPLVNFLLGYETASRPDGVLMAALMLLSFFAPFLPRGRPRQIALLCFLFAWVSLITPVASHQWDARVAIPPLGPVSAAAALGLWQVGRLARGPWHRLRQVGAHA